MIPSINVQARGVEELQMKFANAPDKINKTLTDAATLVGDKVLNTTGLRRYPPATSANRPPVPYYQRGEGMWVYNRFKKVKRVKGYKPYGTKDRWVVTQRGIKNLGNSENLGKQFYSLGAVTGFGSMTVTIGNRASYAPSVIGEQQSAAMARIGWRKLGDVAREKYDALGKVIESVIGAALKRAGL